MQTMYLISTLKCDSSKFIIYVKFWYPNCVKNFEEFKNVAKLKDAVTM